MRPVPALSPEHLPRSKFLRAWFGAFVSGDVEIVATGEGPTAGWFIVVALGSVGCFREGRAHYKCRLEGITKRVSFWVLADRSRRKVRVFGDLVEHRSKTFAIPGLS